MPWKLTFSQIGFTEAPLTKKQIINAAVATFAVSRIAFVETLYDKLRVAFPTYS